MTQLPTKSTPQPTAAAAILQRRLERQRFDSADYAMAMQQKHQVLPSRVRLPSFDTARRAPAPMRLDSDDFSDWVQCEAEPEPESPPTNEPPRVPLQQVRRIRLQRFDSADWAMESQKVNGASSEKGGATIAHTVAKLRLERHAFATCSFVTTPIETPAQNFVKNA